MCPNRKQKAKDKDDNNSKSSQSSKSSSRQLAGIKKALKKQQKSTEKAFTQINESIQELEDDSSLSSNGLTHQTQVTLYTPVNLGNSSEKQISIKEN